MNIWDKNFEMSTCACLGRNDPQQNKWEFLKKFWVKRDVKAWPLLILET